jgi:uncharacterized iron-regulated membrane protein
VTSAVKPQRSPNALRALSLVRRAQKLARRIMPTRGRALAFLSTVIFFAVFGIPWFFVCGRSWREWWNDARAMYHKLAGDK